MHTIQQNIISIFRKNVSELSTSQILEKLEPNYLKLKNKLGKVSKEKEKQIKEEIAKLHRRILHHINKLINIGILKVERHGERGEKFFSLTLSEDEELILPEVKKRIVISKPRLPAMPIEGYEQKGIVKKYEPATWIDRLNSVVLKCENLKETKNLRNILNENIFPCINDAVCLESFEEIINKSDVKDFLKQINLDAEDYGKEVNFSINISNIKNESNFFSLLRLIEETNLKNLTFIFNIKTSDLHEYFKILYEIINTYLKKKHTLYLKNREIHNAPYFLGKAGPYCIEVNDWKDERIKEQICVACSQSSTIVDVRKFHLEYGLNSKKFLEMLLNISKSILSANSLQRRKLEDYFKKIIELNERKEFLEIARNYIRFWNFNLSQTTTQPELIINLINEGRKKVKEFAAVEEIIYNSCGMPTSFKLAFSCAFRGAEEKLSQASYEKLEIRGFEELYNKKMKKQIIVREILSDIFDGGNDVTFHRVGNVEIEDIIRELGIILNTYKLPFFSYDFEKVRGDLKITQFLK